MKDINTEIEMLFFDCHLLTTVTPVEVKGYVSLYKAKMFVKRLNTKLVRIESYCLNQSQQERYANLKKFLTNYSEILDGATILIFKITGLVILGILLALYLLYQYMSRG